MDVDRVEGVDYFEGPSFNVFESIRTYGGIPFQLEEHLQRLRESSVTSGLELKDAASELKKKVMACLKQVPRGDYFIRLTLTPKHFWILFLPEKKRDKAIYQKGVSVRTAPTVRHSSHSSYPGVKSSNFLNQVLGTLDMGKKEVFEIMFLSPSGELQEARTWNFFLIKKGTLRTPDLPGILGGVTRKFVIELASILSIPVEETTLSRADAYNADEAFLTNTSGEIVPIQEWDGRKIGNGKLGPLTKSLTKKYKQEVRNWVKRNEK